MRKALSALLVFAVGGLGTEAAFLARGRMDGGGWYWAAEAYAQWQFFDLAWEGEHLLFALSLETRGWRTPPPPLLPVTLTFSSFGCPARTQSVSLQRVAEHGPFVRYFGQVVLSRREVGFGSYLVVGLRARAAAEVGVHAQALSLVRPVPGGSGVGGPLVPAVGSPAAPAPDAADGAPPSWGIRECRGPEEAPYLAPGPYWGELGWAGPGHDLDDRDWFRVILKPGQLVELRVQAPHPVLLRLLSPSGQEVGRVTGQGRLGLAYEARENGAHLVCLALAESAPRFAYTVELAIRR